MSGRDLGSVVSDIQAKLAAVQLDRGYHAELLGEYQERQAAQSRLLESAVIAGVLILLLLQASFRSWRLAVLAFLTLPMALVGGVLGGLARRRDHLARLAGRASSPCSASPPATGSC